MRTQLGLIVLSAAVALGACGKSEDKKSDPAKTTKTDPGKTPASDPSKPDGDKPLVASADPIGATGVEAGGLEREADEGPAAVLTAMTGTVEVRRVGETEYAAATKDDAL
jgi:hypothetical protein